MSGHVSGAWSSVGRVLTVGVTALLFGAVIPACAAQRSVEALRGLSLDALMSVEVVTVGRKEQTWLEASAALHVISHDEIRRSGARSLPDLLRLVPGMHVARINSNTWAVSARGFADAYSDKLLVMIDGRSLYTPLFSGVFWRNHDLLFEDIERIEVVRGPGASVWGANAVNGVINIITRNAAATMGTLIQAGIGDEDQIVTGLRQGGRLGEAGHYRVWGKHVERDELALPSGEGATDAWGGTWAGARLDWTGGERDSYFLAGGFHRGRRELIDEVLSTSEPLSRFTRALAREETWDLSFRWKRVVSDRSDLVVSAWFDGSDRDGPDWREVRHQQSVEMRHRLRFGGRHEVSWGVGYFRSEDRVAGSFEVALSEPRHVFERASAHVQGEIGLTERLRLTLGTKLETGSHGTGGRGSGDHQAGEHSGLEWQPTLRLAWNPTPRVLAWASASRALRTPNRVDNHSSLVLGIEEDPGGGPPLLQRAIGNPELRPERLLAWEAGVRWQPSEQLTLELAGFVNEYRHLRTLEPGEPSLVPNAGAPYIEIPLLFDSLARARSSGGELGLSWLVHRRWKLALAWSFLELELLRDAESLDALSDTGAGRGHAPRHRVHLSSRVDLPQGWEFDVELDRPIGWNGPDIQEATRMDLRLAWHRGERVELSISVQDALSDGHAEFGGNPFKTTVAGVERSVHLKSTWRF